MHTQGPGPGSRCCRTLQTTPIGTPQQSPPCSSQCSALQAAPRRVTCTLRCAGRPCACKQAALSCWAGTLNSAKHLPLPVLVTAAANPLVAVTAGGVPAEARPKTKTASQSTSAGHCSSPLPGHQCCRQPPAATAGRHLTCPMLVTAVPHSLVVVASGGALRVRQTTPRRAGSTSAFCTRTAWPTSKTPRTAFERTTWHASWTWCCGGMSMNASRTSG